jgi:hypothetical protein
MGLGNSFMYIYLINAPKYFKSFVDPIILNSHTNRVLVSLILLMLFVGQTMDIKLNQRADYIFKSSSNIPRDKIPNWQT